MSLIKSPRSRSGLVKPPPPLWTPRDYDCSRRSRIRAPRQAAISFVQEFDNGGNSSGGSQTTSGSGSPVTSGNLLVVMTSIIQSAMLDTVTVTDSSSNTYHQACAAIDVGAGNGNSLWCHYAYGVTGGTGLTVTSTLGFSASEFTLAVCEYSGVASATDPLDKNSENAAASPGTGSPSADPDSGNVTTTVANELVVGMVVSLGRCTSGPGFTTRFTNTGNAWLIEDLILGSPGVTSGHFTSAGSGFWACAVATFMPPAPPPPPSNVGTPNDANFFGMPF
jgi:hypothetical protein